MIKNKIVWSFWNRSVHYLLMDAQCAWILMTMRNMIQRKETFTMHVNIDRAKEAKPIRVFVWLFVLLCRIIIWTLNEKKEGHLFICFISTVERRRKLMRMIISIISNWYRRMLRSFDLINMIVGFVRFGLLFFFIFYLHLSENKSSARRLECSSCWIVHVHVNRPASKEKKRPINRSINENNFSFLHIPIIRWSIESSKYTET